MLWFKQQITLGPSLPPAEVWERLNRILRRFLVPSGVAIPRHSISFSRNYVGTLKGERFTLSGPTPRKPALYVEGSITRDGAATLIPLLLLPSVQQPENTLDIFARSSSLGALVSGPQIGDFRPAAYHYR